MSCNLCACCRGGGHLSFRAALHKSALLVGVPVAVRVSVLQSLALVEAALKSVAMRVPGISALPAMSLDPFGAAPVILLIPLILAPGGSIRPAEGHDEVAFLLPPHHTSLPTHPGLRQVWPVTGYEQIEYRCTCQVSSGHAVKRLGSTLVCSRHRGDEDQVCGSTAGRLEAGSGLHSQQLKEPPPHHSSSSSSSRQQQGKVHVSSGQAPICSRSTTARHAVKVFL